MFKQITLLSILTAIFAFGTVTSCKKKKKRRHKSHKKWKKDKGAKKKCKRLYEEILAETEYKKKDVKNMFGSKDGFISACKAGSHGGPFKKLLKCRKRDEKLAKCGKKHLARIFGKKVDKKKDKVKKIKKDKKVDKVNKVAPAGDDEGKDGLFKDVANLGELLFKLAAKGDFDAVKKLVVTKDDVKAFDKGTIFAKFANEKKLKEQFEKWQKMFKGTTFKKVKAKDNEKQTVKPGEKVKKLEELTAAIKAPVTVWNVNVKADKEKKVAKCAFVAIQLGEKWKLIRLKGCKVK